MIGFTRRVFGVAAATAVVAPALGTTSWARAAPALKVADIGNDLALHYVEAGSGSPVIFVHGSISDYTYWHDQFDPFANTHRVIAYSRRYNYPNINPARAGYSAYGDAADLAALIERLDLGPAHIVGHSYGAFTALILATRRPGLVRTLVLAEAPAVSLLGHVQGERSAEGKAMLADIRSRMVAPMTEAFRKGERERGVEIFVDYVNQDPHEWEGFSAASKAETMRDVGEWDVMMTTGELFPEVTPAAVRGVAAPALLLSGAKSYPFLGVIDEELTRLLPNNRRIVLDDAGHQMWFQRPEICRSTALAFQAEHSSA